MIINFSHLEQEYISRQVGKFNAELRDKLEELDNFIQRKCFFGEVKNGRAYIVPSFAQKIHNLIMEELVPTKDGEIDYSASGLIQKHLKELADKFISQLS